MTTIQPFSFSFKAQQWPCHVHVPVHVPHKVETPAPGANRESALPLLCFLHGKGERGADGLAPTRVGLGPVIEKSPERFPFLVAFPQCPADTRWSKSFELIDAAIEAVAHRWPVDPFRIGLTGVSMGGFGTWLFGAHHAGRFRCLLPVCGGGKAEDASRLASVPIWAFHGAQDDVIPPTKSREMVQAVKNAGGTVHYTEFPDLAHNCWDRVYTDPNPIRWLTEHLCDKSAGS